MSLTGTPALQTLLLVENDPDLLKFISRLLTKGPFTVLSARNANQAMQIEAGFLGIIHLLLVSLTLPKVSGTTLATMLEERRPGLPVMVMSGYPEGATVAGNNGWEFISKPFDAPTLLRQIEAFAAIA